MKKINFQLWLSLKIWQKIIIALIAGVITGILLGDKADYLKPIGSLFINAIHMLIVPVIFNAIICAVMAINDPQRMRRVGLKVTIIYIACMVVAASLGLGIATLISPGNGLHLLQSQADSIKLGELPTLTDTFINLIPSNPVTAFTQANILQILIFAVLLGIAVNLAGKPAEPVAIFFKGFSSVTFKLAEIVMSFAPYGIFALMAWVTGSFGIKVLIPLLKLVGTVYLCCFLLNLFFSMIILIYIRKNPLHFFKSITDAMLFALSSCSSAATLPVSMKCAEDNLGISSSISRFLLPLGTTLNLNGLSIYLGVATIFAANVYGVHLSFIQYLTIVFTVVVTCMGAGGIPGSAIIVMGAVMSSVNLPIGVITLIAGVDRLNDMAQTTTNVIGDLFATYVIAKNENEITPEETSVVTAVNTKPDELVTSA